ncbi:MAG: hypothetical protein V4850_30695 [Myxococcota bacterium]
MFHLVARALPKRLLFRTHAEALALFHALARAFPEALALTVMPDHVHLVLPHADPSRRLARVMSGYTRWRNHARNENGPVWAPHPPPERLPNAQHARRTVRYVHLNPCRARLVGDPLAWPYSSHRDAVGFAARPVRPVEANPVKFHAWVSGDPTVSTAGTALPAGSWGEVEWAEIVDAVGGVCRVAPEALLQRGTPRTLAVRTAWAHGLRDLAVLTEAVGMDAGSVRRTCATVPGRGGSFSDPALEACVRAVGDHRFVALRGGDLLARNPWAWYRAHGYR